MAPTKSGEGSSKEEEELESYEDSSSLPSSQEEDVGSKIRREISLKDNDQEESEYESAEEV